MSFIAEDKFIASEEFIALARDIDKHAIANNMKPTDIYFAPKVIPKYDAEKAKKGGEAFTKKRAVVIKMRKRMPPAGSRMKMVIALRLYKGIETSEFGPDIAAALKAIDRHNVRAEKLVTGLKEAGKKKRETLGKAFDKNLVVVEELLLAAGLKKSALAVGQSMMGKTLVVKLPNGGYISVGKADEEKFLKAKEPASEKPAPFGRGPKAPVVVVPAKKSKKAAPVVVPAEKPKRGAKAAARKAAEKAALAAAVVPAKKKRSK